MEALPGTSESGDRLRIRTVCRELMGAEPSDAFIVQIVRVVLRIAAKDDIERITTPKDVVAVFRSKGLIPPCLLERLEAVTSVESLAVCFAACIYPNRAYALQNQLERRLASFLVAFRSRKHPFDLLAGNQLQGTDSREIDVLLRDLSAAEYVRGKDEQQKRRDMQDRKTGAALYLLTWEPEDVETILDNWQDDKDLVRYIRTFLPMCPSDSAGRTNVSDGSLDWDGVQAALASQAETDHTPVLEPVISLEKHIRRRAGRRVSMSLGQSVSQIVTNCWESHWDKLISGFPYYSFRSHYAWWWRQCVGTWILKAFKKPTEKVDDEYYLTEEELLFFREGYRLVRTTFFARDDPDRTPLLRRVLDALWYSHLEKKLAQDDEKIAVKKIFERFEDQGIAMSTVNNLSRRGRVRIWVYTLSRSMGWSNNNILEARLPTQRDASDRAVVDKTNKAGALTVSSLARIVPKERTLLWAFTAHRYLRSKIEPQHPDPWTFEAYLQEFWRWAAAGSLNMAAPATKDDQDRDRVNNEADSLMRDKSSRKLLEDLLALEEWDQVSDYLQNQGRALAERVEKSAINRCLQLAGRRGIENQSPKCLKQWRKMVPSHWIVPVWYLAAMEQLDEKQTIGRLQVDPQEREAVAGLHKAMTGGILHHASESVSMQ